MSSTNSIKAKATVLNLFWITAYVVAFRVTGRVENVGDLDGLPDYEEIE